MTEPMDEAQADAMELEYELGYTAGHIAGVRAMWEAEREAREPIPAPRRPSTLPWRLFLAFSVFTAGWFAYIIEAGLLDRTNALLMGVNIGTFMTTCSWKRMSR